MRKIKRTAWAGCMPRASSAARATLVLLVLLAAALPSAHASTRSRELTRQGYTLAYFPVKK